MFLVTSGNNAAAINEVANNIALGITPEEPSSKPQARNASAPVRQKTIGNAFAGSKLDTNSLVEQMKKMAEVY